MIEITKEPNADSRSAKDPSVITKEELKLATDRHIQHVSDGLDFIAGLLKEAAKKHDFLKVEKLEAFHKALTGGKIKESDWYEEHVTKERHHLITKVPDDVNLIDVFEHMIDCIVAGLSRSGEIYDVELDPRILEKAHKNTIELIKKNVKVLPAPVSDDPMDTPMKND